MLFSLDPNKAPGLDGMPGLFFKTYWSTVGNDVIQTVQEFFVSGSLLPTLNEANIVLIPKVDNPFKLNDYRLISLCNTIYKVI